MFFSNDILFAFLISVIASATNTDLATNTNILLLLLLALQGNNSGCCENRCCNPNSPSSPRLFG
ncbi:MAG: hypothetical protein ACOX6H_02810 [Christensenellales bacterium]